MRAPLRLPRPACTLRRVALAALLAAVTGAGTLVAPPRASAVEPTVTVVDSVVTVRPAEAPTGTPDARLVAAGNEFESFQIVVRAGDTAITDLSVRLSAALSGPAGTIPAANVSIYREAYYDVFDPPSDGEGAVGRWPDALIPATDPFYGEARNAFTSGPFRFDVPVGENRVAWIDVLVPRGQAPGEYTGSIAVSGSNVATTVPVSLTVVDAQLPSTPTHRSSFGITHRKVCEGHFAGGGCPSTDEQWKLFSLYARAALDNRMSLNNPNPGVPGQGATTELFRRYNLPLYDGQGPTRLPGARLQQLLFEAWCDDTCLAGWKAEAEASGFTDQVGLYPCDEPTNSAVAWENHCKPQLERMRRYFPDAPALVTTAIQHAEAHDAAHLVDTMVPVENFLDNKPGAAAFVGNQRPAYDSWLSADLGRRLWTYQACFSHGCDPPPPAGNCEANPSTDPYWNGWSSSYVIDQPASQHRSGGWMGFLYDLSGELYYETVVSYWQLGNGPDLTDAWKNQYCYGGHGDGTLFYPGRPDVIGGTTHIPIESMRMKRIRDGKEDYELLQVAAAHCRGGEARQIAQGLFGTEGSMYKATVSGEAFQQARRDVLALVHEPNWGAQDGPAVERCAGRSRWATAATVSEAGLAAPIPVAFVATGLNFPDALAGGAAGAHLGGPVLLATRDDIPVETEQALERLAPQRIVVLGSGHVISDAVTRRLQRFAPVERIGGIDRYQTAALVSRSAFATAPRAYVATGLNFPDALAGAAVAGRAAAPMLLATRDALPGATADELRRLATTGLEEIVILGGEGAISAAVQAELDAIAPTVRVQGGDRYATAVAISQTTYAAADTIFVATGTTFPDALAASPVAGRRNAPVLLVDPNQIPAVVGEEIRRLRPRTIVILGGPAAVSPGVEEQLRALLGQETPDSPSGLAATPLDSDSVRLTWNPAPGADEQKVYAVATAAACPLSLSEYGLRGSTTGTATEFLVTGLEAGTRYCFAVTTVDDGVESTLDEGSTEAATTAGATTPRSTDIDFEAGGTAGALDSGDRVVVSFDQAVNATGAEIRVIDHEGDEATITCGTNATCSVSGSTLTVAVTDAPASQIPRTDGIIATQTFVEILSSTVAGEAGPWNVPASGLPGFERVFGDNDPTNSALPAAITAADVTVDVANDTVTVTDADCSPLQDWDGVRIYAQDGNRIGIGEARDEDGDGSGCTATLALAVDVAAGDVIYITYRRSGPYIESATTAVQG